MSEDELYASNSNVFKPPHAVKSRSIDALVFCSLSSCSPGTEVKSKLKFRLWIVSDANPEFSTLKSWLVVLEKLMFSLSSSVHPVILQFSVLI